MMRLPAKEDMKASSYKTLFTYKTVVNGGSSSTTASSVTFAAMCNALDDGCGHSRVS